MSAVDEKLLSLLNEYLKGNVSFYLSTWSHNAPISIPCSFYLMPRPKCRSISHDLILSSHVFAVVFLISLMLSASAGPGFGGRLTERHLVQKRRLPQSSGPDLARTPAQLGPRDAVS